MAKVSLNSILRECKRRGIHFANEEENLKVRKSLAYINNAAEYEAKRLENAKDNLISKFRGEAERLQMA